MNAYKLILPIVSCVFIASCDRQPESKIGDDERQYFNQVQGIIHPLLARFEHIKALMGNAGNAQPTNRWLDDLAQDADDLDNLRAALIRLQPPASLADYNQRLLAVATELGQAADGLHASIKYIRSGDMKAAASQLQQMQAPMIAIGKIIRELDQRTRTMEGSTNN
jgi:hypothetical protein